MRSWMIGALLGMLAVAYFPALPASGWLAFALPLLPLTALPCRAAGVRRLLLLFSGLGLGLAFAVFYGNRLLDQRLPGECEGVLATLEGQVVSLVTHRRLYAAVGQQRFEFKTRQVQPQRCSGPQKLLLSYYGAQTIEPGSHWRFEVKLRPPRGLANPAGFDRTAWYAANRVDAIGTVVTGTGLPLSTERQWGDVPLRWRSQISRHIEALGLPGKSGAVLRALTVADSSGIDPSLWQKMKLLGVNHLLVISGLHIGLAAGLGLLLGKGLQRVGLLLPGADWSPAMPLMMAMACGAAYALLAGLSLSTQRALIMLTSVCVAGLCQRSSGPFSHWLLAAFCVLVVNPLAGIGAGFWLSFGLVASLLWRGQWQGRQGGWRWLASTHLYLSLVMVPLGGWWLGGSSVIAPLANLLLVPLTAFFIVPLALLGVLLLPVYAPGAESVWRLASWPLEQLLRRGAVLDASAAQALFWAHGGAFAAAVLCVVVVLLAPVRVGWRVQLLVCAAPLLMLFGPAPRVDEGDTVLTVLDVGQGTAVVLRAGARTLVYDTGGGDPAGMNMAASVVLPYLASQGIGQLDTLVISHPDNDHSAGTAALREALDVEKVFFGRPVAGAQGGHQCLAGDSWAWPGDIRFQFLSPPASPGLSSNNSSCVLQIDLGGYRLLLPGDIDRKQEKGLVEYWRGQLASDWLLVAHHGSKTSTSALWLKYVNPAIAVYSNAYLNRFGHPHADVDNRLGHGGVQRYSTAHDGALQFRFRRGELRDIQAVRAQRRRYWY